MFARSAAAVLFLSTFAAAANYTLANPGAISDTLKGMIDRVSRRLCDACLLEIAANLSV
jgi:hypothetical protein